MPSTKFTFAATLLLALGGCQTVYENTAEQLGEAAIRDRQGRTVGTARLFSLGGEMTVNASFTGLPAGQHAVHLHTTGVCSGDFTSAGGHLNPGNNEHGTANPRGAHLGDLPNVTIAADGTGTMSAVVPGTRESGEGRIFDGDGTAIIVHESADDYRTDPTGNAGGRIACGVMARG